MVLAMKKLFLIVIAFVVFAFGYKVVANSQTIEPKASTNEILVKFKKEVSEPEKEKIHQEFGITAKKRLPKIEVDVVKIPKGKAQELIGKYKNKKNVLYAELNGIATASYMTNDPDLSQEWGMFKINAASSGVSAWNIATGSSQVKIAILDTGIEESHQDISGKVVASANFSDSPTVIDQYGHGTHVAGAAAAATNNGIGVAGVGYESSLMNGKVLGDTGSGYYSWVANGIVWAADNGAKVINMSLGGSPSSQALEDAVNYAWSKGVVVVSAAGNSGSSAPSYPAYYTNSIAVAATDSNDTKASWSNFGSWVDVAAPGVSIYSTYKGNTYAVLSGTSMATPYVSGLAALVWAKGDCATNACVRDRIEQTADKVSGTGTYWTWGRINAYNAVSQLLIPSPTPIPPTPTATPTPTLTPIPLPSITVSDIAMWYVVRSSGYRDVYARVKVIDEASGADVSSASVSATITSPSGRVNMYSGYTNSNGQVTFRLRSREKGTYVSQVTGVSKSGFIYHPTLTTKSLLVN